MAEIIVTTFADVDIDGTQTTLREAVEQANATPEADIISFEAGATWAELSQGALTVTSDIEIRGVANENRYSYVGVSANGMDRAFDVQSGTLTLNYVEVVNGSADQGGGIYVAENAGLILDHTLFDGNTAGTGGAIFAAKDASIAITDSYFEENTATAEGGGAIASQGADLVIVSSGFFENGDYLSDAGGAILAKDGDVTIIGSEFEENAAQLGGGISVSGTLLTVSDTEITFNFSAKGGGLYATDRAIVSIANQTEFHTHHSAEGGAIYVDNKSSLTISDSVIRDNSTSGDGGGIFANNAFVIVNRTDFLENFAEDGGAVFANQTDLSVASSQFHGNFAYNAGGTIAGDEISLAILDSSIGGGFAVGDLGGGIFLKNSQDAFIRGTTLSASSVPTHGAAIHLDESNIIFADTTLSNSGADYSNAYFAVTLPFSTLSGVQLALPDAPGTVVDIEAVFGGLLPQEITSAPLAFSGLLPLTLLGGDEAENLKATAQGDTIFANAGDDIIDGSEGADVLFGGAGNDSIIGGAGNDTLTGGLGSDTLLGGAGDDTYIIDDASDLITGEVDDASGGGWDIVFAAQSASLSANVEELFLGAAGDTFSATGRGNSIDNVLRGNAGQNTLFGADGDDTLFGGEGDDNLDGGDGADLLDGGRGDDTYTVDSSGDQILGEDVLDGDYDTVLTWIDYVLPEGLESLEMQLATTGGFLTFALPWDGVGIATGNSADNHIVGNALSNTLSGLDGNDVLFGGAGVDTLYGGQGDDTLDGGLFRDFLYGNDGNDHLVGSFTDSLFGGRGDDVYTVEADTVTIVEEETFAQGGGIDTVRSTTDHTLGQNFEILRLLDGDLDGTGNDAPNALVGSDGANLLIGRGGNDRLIGRGGDDRLVGNTGADTLVGGDGADTFILTTIADSRAGRETRDFINGFERGLDRIDMSMIDANRAVDGNQEWSFIGNRAFEGEAGQLRYFTFNGGNYNIVEADLNGDTVADLQVFVNGTHWMTGTDFIL